MMTESKPTKTAKKSYLKPQVTEVRLVAEQAVLANCKNSAGGPVACLAAHDTNCVPNSSSAS